MTTVALGHTVHGGSAFAGIGKRPTHGKVYWQKAASVHDGRCFAMYERRKLGVPVFTERIQRLLKRRPELILVLKLRLNQLVAHAHILVLGVGGKGR